MTDVNRRPGKQRLSIWHWPTRFGLVVLALAVLALPFYAAAEYYLYGKYMSTQVQPPTVRIDAKKAASWSAAAESLLLPRPLRWSWPTTTSDPGRATTRSPRPPSTLS